MKAKTDKRPAYFPKVDRAPEATDPQCRIWGHDLRNMKIDVLRCIWCGYKCI